MQANATTLLVKVWSEPNAQSTRCFYPAFTSKIPETVLKNSTWFLFSVFKNIFFTKIDGFHGNKHNLDAEKYDLDGKSHNE